MTTDRETARAKVNLFLHVLGRRPDGYHLLDSLAVFPEIGDSLEATPADSLMLEVTGPFAAGLPTDDNLVLLAARRLQAAASVSAGAHIVLDKRLPVASGIGGGSADAAAALRLLARLWRIDLPQAALAAVALELGADVPVCLASQPARMGGIGELVGIAPALPEAGIVLVNPREPVATAEVFRARTGPYSSPADLPPAWPDAGDLAGTLATLANDLEAPAVALCPAIARVLAWLRDQPGVLLARMSGSGATCYALTPDPATATSLSARVPPSWWSWGGALHR